jgi:dCTP diphosphatase
MKLNSLVLRIRQFCEKRGWSNSDPNQLITSAVIELGELSEHYQWKKEIPKLTDTERKEISYEFVDVLFYLLRLADKTGIDLEKAFEEKIPKLEKKFPVGSDRKKQNRLYRENGKNGLYE